jgi:hypothetical protein
VITVLWWQDIRWQHILLESSLFTCHFVWFWQIYLFPASSMPTNGIGIHELSNPQLSISVYYVVCLKWQPKYVSHHYRASVIAFKQDVAISLIVSTYSLKRLAQFSFCFVVAGLQASAKQENGGSTSGENSNGPRGHEEWKAWAEQSCLACPVLCMHLYNLSGTHTLFPC